MSKITAGTTTNQAIVTTGDTSGALVFETNGGTAALTLAANQAATFASNVTVGGTLTATGGIPAITTALTSPLNVGQIAGAGAEIRLPEATPNGSNYIAVKAPDNLAANLTLTLPSADGTSGQFLQTNGSGTLSFATPASGSLLRVTVFTSSGTWTKGAGTNYIKVRGVGGGGGGAGGRNSVAADNGGGGGAGGYAEKFINTSGVSTVAVTIGSGGSGGAANNPGSTGGATTFGAYFTCNPGSGGQTSALTTNAGGAGGTSTGGDLNVIGGGGNAGGTANRSAPSGLGGSSAFGGGGSGVVADQAGSNGQNGNAYGSGASGGTGHFSSTGGTGGTGASGVVIVEEYA